MIIHYYVYVKQLLKRLIKTLANSDVLVYNNNVYKKYYYAEELKRCSLPSVAMVMKRFLDILFSFFALIILSPLFLIVSVVVLIDNGAPVLFKQERVGKDNKLFKIYKFRTMKFGTRDVATEQLVESEERITKSGKFLRKTSIDELPQLINILKGDMSFVGPRPLIPQENEIRIVRAENNIFVVRPGITGLAQINGRDELGIEEKVRFDKEYVENQSILLDIKIIIKTVGVVIRHEGIKEGGYDGNK